MLEEFPERLGRMVAGWLRVGFCQGNFNSDNCRAATLGAVAPRTLRWMHIHTGMT